MPGILLFCVAVVASLAASWLLVSRLERLGERAGFSEAWLGLVAALAADAPEITSSVVALARGQATVGAGVIIGSNVFNLAALLGLAAMVAGSIGFHRRVVVLSGVPAVWLAAVCLLTVAGVVTPVAGLGLAAVVLVPYVAVLGMSRARMEHLRLPARWVRWLLAAVHEEEDELAEAIRPRPGTWRDAVAALAALIVVVGASTVMEVAATAVGHRYAVADIVTGGLALAVVTSLPNAVSAVYLARRGRGTAVLSTALNSNAINVVGGLLIPASLAGLGPGSGQDSLVAAWYAGLTVLALALAYHGRGLGRAAGAAIIAGYLAFVTALIVTVEQGGVRPAAAVLPAVAVAGASALLLARPVTLSVSRRRRLQSLPGTEGSKRARSRGGGGGVTAGTAEVVITTKLFRPGLRQQTVERKRLYDLLREGRTLPLTLVVAPAGWGKSTIVADWLARDDVTAGWVSLDGGDNDPKRFWRYLLLAADQAGSAAGAAALRRLDAAGSDVLRDVLPAFINELASAEAPLVIVLDDYHLVTSTQVHTAIATLLDRSPPQLHLLLLTRADPPLPLSRLRVRGDLAELRAEDLRFSASEAVEFFSSRLDGAGPPLSEHDVLRLLARTEGWAAGLQLAALRLRGRPDRSDFIERLTGADWHIVNYLGEEVLASQPAEIREFLLVTSVLNRMCAPLCDALTERADGTGLISEINRANLFLVPLDDEYRWFRYHHLFGGLLRHELARTAPDRPPVLHRRAAQWYADHGDAAEAIGHAIASGDGSLSGRLIAAHWRQPFNAGQLETVRMWLDALAAEFVSADASLSAARVWVALDTGRLEEVGAALDAAETSVPQDIQLMVLRALQMYKAGDVGGAAARLREISPSADDPFIATVHRLVQGISWMWLGDTGRARELLVEASRRAEADGNRLAYIYAEGCRALLAVNRGDLALADSLVAVAESAVGQTLSGSHFVAMFPALARARLGIERADWAGARHAAGVAVELGRRGAGRVELAAALLTAAKASRICPDPQHPQDPDVDPEALVGEARGILRHCADPGPLVTTWLTGEQRAAAARTRQEGLTEPLTDRELTILRLLPAPSSLRELASELFVTPNTLKTHLRAIYRKLGAESREEAVIRARERGLI